MFRIALSAGHGYHTPGKRCLKALDPQETREWVLNARVCDQLEKVLGDYDGVEVLRLDDPSGAENPSLSTRVARATGWPADLSLSIHHNAGVKGDSGGGIVAYTHPQSSLDSIQWRDALYHQLVDRTGLRGNRSRPKTTGDFYVLRATQMPAVLLELGFMDSSTDVPVILTEDYARACAQAIGEVIIQVAGLTPKTQGERPADWARAAWERAKAAGVLDGTRPGDGLTRQELAVVLGRLGLI